MKNRELEMPTHKVGIKLLTKDQMRNVLPSYENLLERIKNHRERIGGLQGEKLKHYQYNMMYDNVFSIFGNRGTGKTSVAFTLQKEFEEDETYYYDLVMPIIIPEVIPLGGSVLGWILEIIKEDILDLFKDEKDPSGGKAEYDFWGRCKYQEQGGIYRKLRKHFEELEELYYSVKYNPAAESSYAMAVGNSARQAGNYYKFSRKITEFWDSLVAAIQYKNRGLQGDRDALGGKISPLVYFIFDDVDLAPEKVNELLSVIIKYLSHPNIIVITTADEETVLEVIENNLDTSIGRLPKEWRRYLNKHEDAGNVTEIEKQDLIGKMARLYLGKVMPTSTRYYLKLFERADEKWRFYIEGGMQLGRTISDKLDAMLAELKADSGNFLKAGDVEMDFYLNFFGNTSRQITNTFLNVQEFLEEVKKLLLHKGKRGFEDKDFEEVYELSRHFLQISITANHNLAEAAGKAENFVDRTFWLEHNNWRLFIDYEYLRSFLEDLLWIEKKEAVIRTALQVYSLFMFVENIFVIIDGWGEGGATGRRRVHGIPGMVQFIDEQVFWGRQMFRTDWTAAEFFRHYNTVLNRLCHLSKNESGIERLDREYLYYFSEYSYKGTDVDKKTLLLLFEKDRIWLREMAGILSMVYGNIYLIGTKEIKNCLPYRERIGLSKYQCAIEDILENNIRECLREFDIRSKAMGEVKSLAGSFRWAEDEEPENFADKLRWGLLEGVVEGMISKLYEEYLDSFESSLEEYEELEEGGELTESEELEEDDAFWDFCKEIIDLEYQKAKVLPMNKIIEVIDRQCEGDSLEELLNKLPKVMGSEMAKFLKGKTGSDKLLLALHVVQDFLVRWDERQHGIKFENIRNFIYQADELGKKRSGFWGILTISNQIREYALDSSADKREGYLSDKTFYGMIRKELKNKCFSLEADGSREDRERLYVGLDGLGRGIDVAIDLEDEDEFQDAAAVSLVVQVIKKVQKLYLYQTIIEKYHLDSGSSSVWLEKGNAGWENGEALSKSSFYYAMFLAMKQIAQRKDAAGKESESIREEDALKNLILEAAWEKRNRYLTKLVNEVKNESNAD